MKSDTILKKLLSAINDCAWAYDIDDKAYVFINDCVESVLGTTADALQNDEQLWHKIIIDNDAETVIKLTEDLKEDEWLELTYRVKVKNKTRWISEKKTRFTDPDTGHQIRLGVIKDVSDQKTVKYHLNESLGNFGILFDKNPNPMWIYEVPTLRILKVNEAAMELYGYTSEEFLALTIRDIRPKIDLAKFNNYIFKSGIFKGGLHGYNPGGIWRHANKHGDIIYAEITGHEIQYNNSHCRVVVATNVTERVLFEEEMRKFKEESNAGTYNPQ
jgi:PAS domain S-box-containing protein